MIWAARKTRAMLTMYYALMVAYRGEIVLWTIAMLMPLIMAGIWTKAGETGDFALDAVQFARYFIAAYFIRQLTVVWLIYEFEWYVVSGRLSPLLLQPIHPAWRWVAAHFSEQAARVPCSLVLIVAAFVLFPQALWGGEQAGVTQGLWLPAWSHVVVALTMTYTAFFIRFLMQLCIAVGAFWFERVASWERLNFIVYLFASGLLFPLEVLPHGVRAVLEWTPFPYMLWFPAMMLADGDLLLQRQPWIIPQAFAVMAVWMLAFYFLSQLLWKRGLRHYSAMGA